MSFVLKLLVFLKVTKLSVELPLGQVPTKAANTQAPIKHSMVLGWLHVLIARTKENYKKWFILFLS